MHMEWREEKFLKGIVGYNRRLRFWNKPQMIELFLTQLVRYNRIVQVSKNNTRKFS